jgi:hypothetical protein
MPAHPRRRTLKLLHLEDSEVDHELAMAWLARDGRSVQTLRVDSCRARSARTLRCRPCATAPATTCSRATWPGWPRLWTRHRGQRAPGVPGRRPTVSWPRRASSCPNWPSTCRPASRGAGGDRPRDPRRRGRLAHGPEVRPGLDRPPRGRPGRCSSARAVGAGDRATPSKPASASCTTCARPSWSRVWWRRCSGWRSRFEKRTGIECAFRTSHEHLPLPPGVPLVAYRATQEALTNVSKHAQATRVRSTCRWRAACCRWRSATTAAAWPRRPGQGAQLRPARPARARRDRGRLGRPVQQHGRHHADPVGAAVGEPAPRP